MKGCVRFANQLDSYEKNELFDSMFSKEVTAVDRDAAMDKSQIPIPGVNVIKRSTSNGALIIPKASSLNEVVEVGYGTFERL